MIRVTLESLDGNEAPFSFDTARLTIGRGVRALRDEEPGEALLDVDARHAVVSREHAKLRREGGTVLIENVGKHGTTVNGQKISAPRALADGDVLRLGDDGPRFRVRFSNLEDKGVRRCSGCREILPFQDIEKHERECEALNSRSPRKSSDTPTFRFGPLRSTKRNLLILADLSGGPEGKGHEASLVGPGLIDALRGPGLRFNVLGYGGGDFNLWRGPSMSLHAATPESRAEAKEWLAERVDGNAMGAPALAQALAKSSEFRGLEAVILLASADTGEIAFKAEFEIHAIGLGRLYFADSKAQAILRDLAARHGGGFMAIAARQ